MVGQPAHPLLTDSRLASLPSQTAASRRSLLLWLFVFAALAYLLTAGSNFSSGDAISELHVTASLVHHGWVDVPIEDPHTICAGWGCQGTDGRYYATHGIGYSLMLLPFYLVADAVQNVFQVPRCASWTYCVPIHLVSWSSCLVSAATLSVLCALCLDLGYSALTSLGLALLYGFGTLAWPYARFGFDVTPTALLLLAAVREALLAMRSTHLEAAEPPAGQRRWLRAGCFAGLAILFRLPSLAAIAPLGLAALLGVRSAPLAIRLRRFAVFATPVALALAFSGWYNLVRFGGVLNDGHVHNAADQLVNDPWIGLMGILISPGKGLIWYCPVLVLALVALPRFYERQRAACVLSLAIAAGSVLPYIAVRDWYGGDAWGPRFVLPVLPLLLLPALELPAVLGESALRRILATLVIAVSALLALAGQLVNYALRLHLAKAKGLGDRLFWDPRDSPIPDHLGTLFTYVTHPGAATHTVPYAESFDIWWLNLWRIDQVPPAPVLTAAALLLALTLVALARLIRSLRAAQHTQPSV